MNVRSALLLCLSATLAACGGGGGGNNSPPTPAPSALSYPAIAALTVGTAMTSVTPTVTGTVTSYGVSPALPAGVTLNTTSGAISGTPTAPAASANYTITASNTGGSTTATVTISVKDNPPAINYARTTLSLSRDHAAPALTPTATGGAVTSWTVSPALPAGLSIDAANGKISGTPTSLSAAATYRVTASNSGGNATADITIAVLSDVLFSAGQTSAPKILRSTATRLLTRDAAGNWALWRYPEGDLIASGPFSNPNSNYDPAASSPTVLAGAVDLVADRLFVNRGTSFEWRSAVDGSLIVSVPNTGAATFGIFVIPSDASYVCAVKGGIQCWSRSGQPLGSRGSFYRNAAFVALPGVLRVGGGNETPSAIQDFDPVTGITSAGPAYVGTFSFWYADGNHFVTSTNSAWRIYDSAGTEIQVLAKSDFPSGLIGMGNYFSPVTYSGAFDVYRIGGSTPVFTSLPLGVGLSPTFNALQIGFPTEPATPGGTPPGTYSFLDLSGPSPVRVDTTVSLDRVSGFEYKAANQYLVSYSGGIFDAQNPNPTPGTYGFLGIADLAASDSRVAVAVIGPRIFVFNAATRTLEATLNVFGSAVRLSKDGSILAVRTGSRDQPSTLRIYSVPSLALLNQWDFPNTQMLRLVDFDLSANGSVVSQLQMDQTNAYLSQTFPALGGGAIVTDQSVFVTNETVSSPPVIALSPSGAVASIQDGNIVTATFSSVYQGGTKLGDLPGPVTLWLDENTAVLEHSTVNTFRPQLYNKTGASLATAPQDFAGSFFATKRVSSTSAYLPSINSIVSFPNFTTVWNDPTPVTGNHGGTTATDVVFQDGPAIRIVPF